MPIVLLPTPPEKEMLARISATTRENPADYARLFAFGADAYELAKRVQAMSISEGAAYEGRSGALEVGPGGEIVRRLTWAMFVDGYPLVDGHTRPDPEAPAAPEEPSEPAVPAEVAPAGAGTSAALGPRRVAPAGPPAPGPAVL